MLMVVVAAMGGAYEFTRAASANIRERNSALNSGIGGFFAGSVLGLKSWSFIQYSCLRAKH